MSRHYAGSEWLRDALLYHPGQRMVGDFGERVADLLGDVFRGIYHVSDAVTNKRVDWESSRFITVRLPMALATFDGSDLTRLVVLAHDRCIRVQMDGRKVSFSPREREGSSTERHPPLEMAAAAIREELG